MKNIKGGVQASYSSLGGPDVACCSVTCLNGDKKERECGSQIHCTTQGTTICCSSGDCINVCSGT